MLSLSYSFFLSHVDISLDLYIYFVTVPFRAVETFLVEDISSLAPCLILSSEEDKQKVDAHVSYRNIKTYGTDSKTGIVSKNGVSELTIAVLKKDKSIF